MCAVIHTMKTAFLLSALFFSTMCAGLRAEDFTPEPGFVSLFNGKDLSGWGYVCGEKFDGKTEARDGRYSAKDGCIVVNDFDEKKGPRIRQMWTTQEFTKDFILKLEFRASVNADSGIFLRKPQLQCRDYLVAGPYKDLKQYKATAALLKASDSNLVGDHYGEYTAYYKAQALFIRGIIHFELLRFWMEPSTEVTSEFVP